MAMLNKDAIFTNVGLTADNQPWWEGKDNEVPVTDWHGNPYDPAKSKAAHPNSRFTVSMKQCPSYTDEAEAAGGVPLSAIIFGGRRETLIPLVMESKSWQHGVLLGASMASETTAAATGAVGVVRRDPMAMKPFCGYNFADYWAHWLSFADRADRLPSIFHVNWFRKDDDGKFMWPGFRDNMRVLEWMIKRCKGEAEVTETAIGGIPHVADLNINGLKTDEATLKALLAVDKPAWLTEIDQIKEYLEQYGDRLPAEMMVELDKVSDALNSTN